MQIARLALLGLAILTLAAACWLTGCGGAKADLPIAAEAPQVPVAAAPVVTPTSVKVKPTPPVPVDPVVMIRTSAGDVQVQLFRDKAPQTVDNFLRNYAQRQHYEGTIFHHVDPESMVIAGGYTADLQPKETRTPIYNESKNGLKNTRGMLAMIRDPQHTHSATSQFFINMADNAALDFQSEENDSDWGYCVFGQVIAGMDVVDKIAHSSAAAQGDFEKVPAEPIAISAVEQVR